jgi:hypothetical protein
MFFILADSINKKYSWQNASWDTAKRYSFHPFRSFLTITSTTARQAAIYTSQKAGNKTKFRV